MKKCKECGAELAKEDLFCGECGAKIASQIEEDSGDKSDAEETETDEADVKKSASADKKKSSSKIDGTKKRSSNPKKTQENENDDNDSVILPNCIIGFVVLFFAGLLLKHDWNKLGGILMFFAVISNIVCAMTKEKKTRKILCINLVVWAVTSVFLRMSGHSVVAYMSLVSVICTTIGFSSIKKKLSVVPLIVLLLVAAEVVLGIL